MKNKYSKYGFGNPFRRKNWESDIRKVFVEPCEISGDPLGYRAVFYFSPDASRRKGKESFAVGASLLAQRKNHLSKAGYKAPMTHKAIALIERATGQILYA